MTRSTGHRAAARQPVSRTRLAIAAALLAAVAVVGWLFSRGGDDDATSGAAATSTASSANPDASATTYATGSSAPGTGTTPGAIEGSDDAIVTPTELESYALRGSDLPPGWRTLDAATAATNKLIGECLRTATTPTVPHVLHTGSFRSGSEGPVLTSSVRDFTTVAQSKRALADVRTQVARCVNGSGKPSLSTINLPNRADASVAVGFTITQSGSSARGELIVARVGQRSTTVVLIGLTEKDLRVGRDAVDTVIARMGSE